jgi:serine/threonine protein kinase
MPRLTWLAFAGNPFTQTQEAHVLTDAPTPHMLWSRLQLQQLLGEGASGLIHQATLRTEEGEHTVAVKLFKGAVTSDGLPACEMAACLHAGTHPHLISALGRVTEHPEQIQALVMPLIAPEFVNLAGPPSLESCTRDVYANTHRLSWPAVLRIAQGMASATAHLHARGVLHGDLYAHNILHNTEGDALLGDFGAASFFDVRDAAHAQALQHIEVRALGYLLQELALHCSAANEDQPKLQALTQLSNACMHETPSLRPSLAMLCEKLKNFPPQA